MTKQNTRRKSSRYHHQNIKRLSSRKISFKPNRNSELDFLENSAIHPNREIIVNEKSDSIMLSTA